jgi:tetratricopeptide (TPR) repeat protein
MHQHATMVSCALETRVMEPRVRGSRRHLRRVLAVAGAGLLLFGSLGAAWAAWRGKSPHQERLLAALPQTLSAAELEELTREAEALAIGEDDATLLTPGQDDVNEARPGSLARGRFWMREADRLRRAGRVDEAILALDQARSLLPRTPVPCLKAAQLLLTLNDPKRLLEFATCARERDPRMGAPYLYEGVALQLMGDHAGAAARYATFARIAPGSARAWEARFVGRRLGSGAPGSPAPGPQPQNP